MKPSRGYYSIIQYCPDLGRCEAANVGVLLFCPERHFLKAVTSRNNRRIARFFGSTGHDSVRITTLKRGLEDRVQKESSGIKTVDDLQRFIALRANLLQFTPPKPMRVSDPEKDLAVLYEELIGEPAKKRHSKTLRRIIGEKFSGARLDKKLCRDITVTVPILEKTVEIPFAFQNGRFNLINPVHFEAADPDTVLGTACKYAVEGRSLFQHADPQHGNRQLIVVGRFRQSDRESPARVRRVFKEHDVRLFKASELPMLVDEIRRTGKDIESG